MLGLHFRSSFAVALDSNEVREILRIKCWNNILHCINQIFAFRAAYILGALLDMRSAHVLHFSKWKRVVVCANQVISILFHNTIFTHL